MLWAGLCCLSLSLRVVRGAWCVCVSGYDVCVLCCGLVGEGDGAGVHGRKTTDPLPFSTTSPFLLGWASVWEKSAEVVAPEK